MFDFEDKKWKFLSFMNIEREIFAYSQVNNRYIYVFGGFNVNHLDSIERYDIINDKWQLMNYKMKRPMQNSTAVTISGDKIALVGGYNGALHKSVDVLNLVDKSWTTLEYMEIPRRKSHVYFNKDKVSYSFLINEIDLHIWRRVK